MSNNYANTTIVGRLIRDPELRFLPSGTAVVNFSIPVTEVWGKEDNQKKTTWYNCQIFGKPAEFFNKYASKGTMVAGSGRLSLDEWETAEGEKRSTLRLTLREYEFQDAWGKKEEVEEETFDNSEPTITEDEIPF